MSTRNITRIYREASEMHKAEGLSWYEDAREFAATLDSDVSRAAGVIAALSPMLSWTLNKKMAKAVYDGERRGCLSANIAKAVRIQGGESPLDVLSGNKVRSFYLNIMGIGGVETVTVDRHAISIYDGKPTQRTIGNPEYRTIADAYVRAAKILSKESGRTILPCQVQAVTWVHWRVHYAEKYHK